MKEKTRVLVTHQLQFLPEVDHVFILHMVCLDDIHDTSIAMITHMNSIMIVVSDYVIGYCSSFWHLPGDQGHCSVFKAKRQAKNFAL